MDATITRDAAPGVHSVSCAGTNLYLIEDDDGVTIIDGGLPSMLEATNQVLRERGRTWSDVRGIVLTHGHFDHLGILSHAAVQHHVPVWVHPGDAHIVRHPYRYRPGRPRLAYPALHPGSLRHLTGMVRAGALRVRGVEPTAFLADGQLLDLPGQLTVVATPGHTDGHCVLHSGPHDVVFTGDALVTLDPYTGRTGPRVVARAGTHDAATARASLRLVAATGATVVAPGHGMLWTHGVNEAAAKAESTDIA